MDQVAFWQDIQARSQSHWQRWQAHLGAITVGATPHLSVAIVGRPGVGKSTLLQHLIHPLTLPAGATRWPVSVLTPDPPILWTDTPGWTPEQTPVIQQALAQADMCLWVVTPADTSELQALLQAWGRPVIRVVHWWAGEPPLWESPQANFIATVVVRLFPTAQPLRTQWPDGRVEWSEMTLPVDVAALQTLLADVLKYRAAIACVNRLLVMAQREREWLDQQRQIPVSWWPVVIKAVAVTLAPGLLFKVGISWCADLGITVWLSRRLHLPLTRYGIERLVMALGLSSGAVGLESWFAAGQGGFTVWGDGFWGGLTGYGVQQVARAYLQQGVVWASNGPQDLLQRIYRHLSPGSWLHSWVEHCLRLVNNLS
ncbi:MAG: GTPase domain-containing protein [Gloeomargarita sp. SKYG116]|nr:GTPase domain-containing protein [Gloeomargarita sp. SKYG116]MDW8401779.1 GTPase domain-containing protein [Gloeomargarita sp. SKYGB_i_bin116]